MIEFYEEAFEPYCKLYDTLSSKIRSDGGHVPPSISPYHFAYAEKLCEASHKFETKLYSIRNPDNTILGLLQGFDVIEESTHRRSLGLNILPCILFEDRDAVELISAVTYNKALKMFVNKFDNIYCRDYCYDGKLTALSSHLATSGAQISTGYTRVINIHIDGSLIWDNIRKNYRRLIKKFDETGKIFIYTSQNIKTHHLEQISHLHKTVAGVKTRSWKTWLEQLRSIQEDKAFLVCAVEHDKIVAYSYFLCSGQTSFYASAACIDHTNGASPATIWGGIKHAKKIGSQLFDIGQQTFQSEANQTDQSKLQSISFFKRGFGGADQIFLDINLEKNNA